jgi:hypothetical protein
MTCHQYHVRGWKSIDIWMEKGVERGWIPAVKTKALSKHEKG